MSDIDQYDQPPVHKLSHTVTPRPEDQDPDVEPDLSFKAVVATVAAALSYVTTVYAISLPAFILNDVTATLGGAAQRAWVIQVIALCAGVLAPPLGLAADLVGRRWILICSMVLGLIGALISGQATSMNMLIAGRVVCGCGNGAQGISLAIPSEVLPRRYRPFGQAFASGSVAVFNIAGLLAGGAFVKHNVGGVGEGWRYVFHVEAILWGLNALLLFLVYRPPTRRQILELAGLGTVDNLSFLQKLHKIDVEGAALLALFLIPFMLGLGWLNSPYDASNPHVAASLAIGLAFGVAFLLYEWKGRSDGILHHDLFRQSRNMALAMFGIFTEGTAFFSYQLFYPIGTAILWESDPVLDALRDSLPFWGFLLIAPLGAIYMAKTRDVRAMPVLGFTLMMIGVVGLATVGATQTKAAVGWAIIFSAGFALPLTLITVIVQFCAPGALMATSTGLFIAVRAVGGTAGSTIVLAVFTSKISKQLPTRVADAALMAGVSPAKLPIIIGAAANFDVDTLASACGLAPADIPAFIGAALGAVKEAYSYSLHYAWYAVIPFTILGIISSLCFASLKDKFTYLIDAPIEAVRHEKHPMHNTVHIEEREDLADDTKLSA